MKELLEVRHLQTSFIKNKNRTDYTSDINFKIEQGETVGIVGESGSGKSITALSIMGLLPKNGVVSEGSILFDGKNLLELSDKEMEKLRGNEISMIFQDTMSALNPVFTIGHQLIEAICIHYKLSKKEAYDLAVQLIKKVGLSRPEKIMKEYSFMLSGGMRQRAMIAMALCQNPKLLIADEPTTALDVTIQAQIVRLLKELREEYKMSILLITHDMGLIAEMADKVIVMYAGEIVEETDVFHLFDDPRHPYTKALLESIPKVTDFPGRKLTAIPGTVPQNYQMIQGCRFRERCPVAFEQCYFYHPELNMTEEGHKVRCFAVEKEGSLDES
ncbi:MAG: oppD 1 [Anaerocolumna sp.]|jgi:oligopeptide/dipeptide ABC transporter ATP-binding protein|nr:oppD 1 [Anaerocolumna sp.]